MESTIWGLGWKAWVCGLGFGVYLEDQGSVVSGLIKGISGVLIWLIGAASISH